MSNEKKGEVVKKAERNAISYATDWGKSSLPPTLLATLVTALHARPLQLLPLSFAPVLLFSSYLNLNSYVIDAAGLSAAWSGLYILLARRRKAAGPSISARFGNRFGARGLTRGAAMGVAGLNVMGGGLTYALGRRKDEDHAL